MKTDPVLARVRSNTYQALRMLIENSCIMQDGAQTYSDVCLAREYGTIRLCSTRQAGHTHSIARMAVKYFDNVLFLSPNQKMSSHLAEVVLGVIKERVTIRKQTISEIEFENGSNYLFRTTTRKDVLDVVRGYDLDAVVVDGTFDLSKKMEDEIYQVCLPCMIKNSRKFFIFVQ